MTGQTFADRRRAETATLLSEIVEAGGRLEVRFDTDAGPRLAIRFDRIDGPQAVKLFIAYRAANMDLLNQSALTMVREALASNLEG